MLGTVVDAERGRDACMCYSCWPHVENHKLKLWTEVRLCDYAIDPVSVSEVPGDSGQVQYVLCERWEDRDSHLDLVDGGEERSHPVSNYSAKQYVIGQPVHDFASPVAALSDSEGMVLSLVHPSCRCTRYLRPDNWSTLATFVTSDRMCRPFSNNSRCYHTTCPSSWCGHATSRISGHPKRLSKIISTAWRLNG